MTKRMDGNVLFEVYVWSDTAVAWEIKAPFFEQSAVVLPAFLL